jgi:fatty acid desaturase
LASLAAAHWRLYPLALLASFMFFLTGPRQLHDAYHCALAVWTSDGAFPARTIRNPLKARLTDAMFYHVEHHLYPAVPTRRLPILARRLDRVAPDLVR